MKRNVRGFTLMELMVVIVIVAVLAAVAVPLYINYVRDAQRTEAKGAIGAVMTGQQAYFQRTASGVGSGTYTTDTTLVNVDLSDIAHNWTITIPAADANGFTIRAVGTGPQTTGLWVQVVYVRHPTPPIEAATWTEG